MSCPPVCEWSQNERETGVVSHHRTPKSSKASGPTYYWTFRLHESINYLYQLSPLDSNFLLLTTQYLNSIVVRQANGYL